MIIMRPYRRRILCNNGMRTIDLDCDYLENRDVEIYCGERFICPGFCPDNHRYISVDTHNYNNRSIFNRVEMTQRYIGLKKLVR